MSYRRQQRNLSSHPKLCYFCGKSIESEEDSQILDSEVYHKICISIQRQKRTEVVEAFSDFLGAKHSLWMALPVIHLFGSNDVDKKETSDKDKKKKKEEDKKKKKDFRDIKVTELLNKATALRNSKSGYLLIYLFGLASEDHFLGAFDEFADVKLQGLINDGSLFDDVYKKSRLSDHSRPKLKEFHDILVLYVEQADSLTTSDFKTKLALDDCVIDIPDLTLLKFIENKRISEKKFHDISAKTAEDLCPLNESRHIQMKACFQSTVQDREKVDYIFDKLRAAEYISAFSKNEDGGSYLLGLVEEPRGVGEYQSKKATVKTVVIQDCKRITELIQQRVSSTCFVCDYEGKEISDRDVVKISFLPTANNTRYVVHISVCSVIGIVFYDKNGPVAYKVDEKCSERGYITRYTVDEWFAAFRSRLPGACC